MRASQLAGSGVPPAAIINKTSAGGVGPISIGTAFTNLGMQQISSGSLTANTLSTVLNVTGRGEINALGVQNAEAVSRTIRAKMTIDGVVVYDATTSANATQYGGQMLVGVVTGGVVALEKVIFNKSFKLEIAASDTASNKLNVGDIYKTY